MSLPLDNTERMSPDSDADVVQRVLHGDIGQFEILMRRYNNRLFRIARGVINEQDEAMDVVQESWIAAYNSLDTFRVPQGFGAWVSRITHNNALMRLRRQTRIDYHEEDELEQAYVDTDSNYIPGPAEQLTQRELGTALESAVNNLPVKYRSVFVLRAVQQLSTKETADSLDLKESAVKQRYLRAKRMLQTESGLLNQIESSGVTIWDFAGERCDQIVMGVFASIDQVNTEQKIKNNQSTD